MTTPPVTGLPHHHTFADWAASAGIEISRLPYSATGLAERAWKAGQDQAQAMIGVMLDDLGRLLDVLGLAAAETPRTPHEWMAEITRIVAGLMPAPKLGPIEAWPATAVCGLCQTPLSAEPVPAGQVFILKPHECQP